MFDDKHNIVHLQNLQPEEIAAKPIWDGAKVNDQWGNRSVARFTFALNVASCGLTASCFKATNIALHIATAIAIYILVVQLLSIPIRQRIKLSASQKKVVALICAALWALHPIQVSTVLYAVQRMTILSALFSVLALNIYCHWRYCASRTHLWLALVALLWAAAFQSKENAAILPLLILAIEVFLPSKENSEKFNRGQFWLFVFGLAVCAIVGFYLISRYDFFTQYPNRDFSPWERLLTQARILMHYLWWVFGPAAEHYTLFHDDISVSRAILQPVSTLLSISFLLVISVSVVILRKIIPLIAFGWFWFLIGHSIESSFLNLELVFEHRNYLPLIGLVIALCYYGFYSLQQKPHLLVVSFAAVILYCMSVSYEKSHQWRSDGSMLVYEARHHPKSVRLNYKVAFLWFQLAETSGISAEKKQHYLMLARNSMTLAFNNSERHVHGLVGLIWLQGQGYGDTEADFWSPLFQRLEHQPPTADIANLLKLLAACYRNQQCVFEKSALLKAYNIYLTRPIKDASRINARKEMATLLSVEKL
ncbi:hypothetical protein [Teredinibacter haidensis]|uniref:hypothetical protein n=1 Tax=Teredinibacter haidensis TaxID=2731755 RepID=UPI0011153DF9|nr:hypothetical protein [Teredinibacter haidensis]